METELSQSISHKNLLLERQVQFSFEKRSKVYMWYAARVSQKKIIDGANKSETQSALLVGSQAGKRFLLVGGGSGGHITPLLAVGRELKAQNAKNQLIYIGERGGKFSNIAEDSKLFDELYYVSAGKLRRYHGESLIRRLIDIKTNVLNIRDVFRLCAGTIQSVFLIRRLKADAALLKGGYVCVPVSIGAKLANVPTVTHDSDALPGLSNRFAARFAWYHATAMPARYYNYPKKSVRQVGVPVNENYRIYTKNEQRFLREKFKIENDAQVVLITGGSNGARRLNTWCVSILPELFDAHPKLHVIHLYGRGNEDQLEALSERYQKRITKLDFTDELFHYSAIADVIITRAGATTMTEFALQSKACIVVPNPDLTGGHQLKNAQVYKDMEVALVVHERELKKSAQPLAYMVTVLLDDAALRSKISENLHKTLPDKPAAKALAELLLEIAA